MDKRTVNLQQVRRKRCHRLEVGITYAEIVYRDPEALLAQLLDFRDQIAGKAVFGDFDTDLQIVSRSRLQGPGKFGDQGIGIYALGKAVKRNDEHLIPWRQCQTQFAYCLCSNNLVKLRVQTSGLDGGNDVFGFPQLASLFESSENLAALRSQGTQVENGLIHKLDTLIVAKVGNTMTKVGKLA